MSTSMSIISSVAAEMDTLGSGVLKVRYLNDKISVPFC